MPFPFVEVPRVRHRPALIVSRSWQAEQFRLYWTVMVTSVDNAGWPDDIDLGESYVESGLPSPSVIRPAKIASVMEHNAAKMGRLAESFLEQVRTAMRGRISID